MIGALAVLDHHVKTTRTNRAELLAWYCAHDGTHCGGPSAARIEARWNERQIAYECGVALLAAAGVVCITRPARLRSLVNRA
jgi:hypothetical protein